MAVMQKPGQRGSETFPSNKDEIAGPRKNLVKMMHLPAVQKRVAQLLPMPPERSFPGLAQVVAASVGKVIGAIKGKYGAKVHIKLIKMLVKLAVSEISLMSQGLGFGKIPREAGAQIAMQAGNMLDQFLSKKGGQPGQRPQGPQGPQQGPPQGQPPQQGPPGPQQGPPMQPQGQPGLLGG